VVDVQRSRRRPTMRLSFLTGLGDARLHAISQNVAFELAKTASIPAGARPLGVVRSRASLSETKPTFSEDSSLQRVHQIHQRSALAVEPPHKNEVNLTPARRNQQLLSFLPERPRLVLPAMQVLWCELRPVHCKCNGRCAGQGVTRER
jgi:hypothetical protein